MKFPIHLKQTKIFFSKLENRNVKWVMGWHQWQEGGYEEGVKEAENGGNII
jgi:hypothetical protein